MPAASMSGERPSVITGRWSSHLAVSDRDAAIDR